MLAALVGSLTACGGGAEVAPAGKTAAVASDTPAETVAPLCSDLFAIGQPIDFAKAKNGCTDPDGTLNAPSYHRCNDGTHLWQIDAATGAPAGYGFDSEPYQAAKDAANDPGYGKAYDTCNAP